MLLFRTYLPLKVVSKVTLKRRDDRLRKGNYSASQPFLSVDKKE